MNTDSRKSMYLVLFAFGIGFFFVACLWRFFYGDFVTEAVGLNWTVFWLAVLGFFVFANRKDVSKESLLWIVPLAGIAISFSIYKNPFTTWISLLFLPILFYIFSIHDRHKNLRESLWSRYLPLVFLISFFEYVGSAFRMRFLDVFPMKQSNGDANQESRRNDVGRQIILGVVILVLLGGFIVIPLLSGASPAFGDIFKNFFDWLASLLDPEKVAQLLVWVLIALSLMGITYHWSTSVRNHFVVGDKIPYRQTITVGIVLVGIIALYFLFIGLQLQTLFMRELPINFSDTERTVKSGFWQLFLLTVFNIILFTVVYGKSTKNIQRLLSVFIVSSLFLVASAAQRMYLYVSTYGLSYEKFFALYTVIFCVLVFLWFLRLLFVRGKSTNIVQTIGFLALWMYALSTLFPIERFVFTTNLALTQRSDSRININELQMLGFDALAVVEKNYTALIREAEKDFFQAEGMRKPHYSGVLEEYNFNEKQWRADQLQDRVYDGWRCWIDEKQRGAYAGGYPSCGTDWLDKGLENKKMWYEKTFAEMVYIPSGCYLGKCIADPQSKGDKDAKMIIWKDPIHGFSFEYPESFVLDYLDEMAESSLLESEFRMTVRESWKEKSTVTMRFFGNAIQGPSKTHTQYRELLAKSKKEKAREVAFGRNLSIRGYAISFDDSNGEEGKREYAILAEFPGGIMVIASSVSRDVVDVWSISDDAYVHLVAPNEKFVSILYSIERGDKQ